MSGWLPMVGKRKSPGGAMRIGSPIFGKNIQVRERGKIEQEEVGIKTVQAQRAEKESRVGNRSFPWAETWEDAHEAGTQAVSGVQGHGRRVACTGFEFPRSGR